MNNIFPEIEPFFGKEVIKVVAGQRRVGKSYLLFQIMDMVKRLGLKDGRIVCVNKVVRDIVNTVFVLS